MDANPSPTTRALEGAFPPSLMPPLGAMPEQAPAVDSPLTGDGDDPLRVLPKLPTVDENVGWLIVLSSPCYRRGTLFPVYLHSERGGSMAAGNEEYLTVTIGRDRQATIWLKDQRLEAHHAVLSIDLHGRFFIKRLATRSDVTVISADGTESPVEANVPMLLPSGARLTLAEQHLFRFRALYVPEVVT